MRSLLHEELLKLQPPQGTIHKLHWARAAGCTADCLRSNQVPTCSVEPPFGRQVGKRFSNTAGVEKRPPGKEWPEIQAPKANAVCTARYCGSSRQWHKGSSDGQQCEARFLCHKNPLD